MTLSAALSRPAALLAKTAGALATPLVPADYLDLVAPLRTGGALRGRVVEVRPEAPDVVTVRVRPSREWRPHRPGQYVRVGVDVDGVRHWRTYSLTSPVGSLGRDITITVKAVADGTVSTHIVRSLRPGALLHLDPPAGDFVLDDERGPTLFLTAGSGITPVMGILRNHLDELDDVVVVHSAPTAGDVIFGDELRALADAGHLRLLERHTRTRGHLVPRDLDELVPDWHRRRTWACGPGAMLDAFTEHYAAAGLGDRLHTERFRAAVVAVGAGGTVSFSRTGADVDVDGATSLLAAGEEAGVLMPSGCRMGICFRCVVPLRQGAVRDLRSGEVTTAVPEDGVRIQTCVSAAAGACDIDI